MARDSDRDLERSSRRSRDDSDRHRRHGRRHRDDGRELEERRRPPRDEKAWGEEEERERRSRSLSREASVDASRKRKGLREDRESAVEKRPRVSEERWRGEENDAEEERREGGGDARKERRSKGDRRERRREEDADEKEERRSKGERRERRREEDGYERKGKEERRERRRENDEGYERKEKDARKSRSEGVIPEERRERKREDDGKRRKDEKLMEMGEDEKRERGREGSVDGRRKKDDRISRDEKRERRREEDGDGGNGKEERELVEGRILAEESWDKRRVDEGAELDARMEGRRKRRGFREEAKQEPILEEGARKDLWLGKVVGEEEREAEIVRKMKDAIHGVGEKLKSEGMEYKVKEERMGPYGVDADGTGSGPGAKEFASGPVVKELELVQNSSAAYHKVSSVTNNIENGLHNRADEVHGKSSTEGPTTSVTGKSGNLLLSALNKAKKALQKQKELAEKLKRIPELDKLSSSGVDSRMQVGTNKGTQRPSLPPSATAAASQLFPGPSTASEVASASLSDPATNAGIGNLSGIAIEAVKRAQEVAARMGFRQDPQFAPLINMFPGTVPEVAIPQKPSKAPVLRLDAQGREIDEYGNVINMPKPTNLSTLKVNINKQKKDAFQILKPDLDANLESNPYFDPRMGIDKTKLLRPKRMSFQFIEEGKWSRQAEIIRFKNQFGEAQAKELKTKQAQLAKAKAEPDINPNLIELSERVVVKEKQKEQIPATEWWDVPLLSSGKYDDIADDKLNMEKISIYVEHPLPIQPPAEPAPPPPQPLKLTKKETKKLRTQRRLAKERDRQEMIRQGLIEPPKPKIKMSNLMKVLGAEATQDPTKLEMEIRSAAAEREQAHVDRNIARKLTPSERREKKEKKLFDDPNVTVETIVTVYKVNSLAHPKARFQVDVNAQENRLTGCAVISDSMCVVVVEGGKRSNKRYKNLMLRRVDWSAAVENEDDGGDDAADAAAANKCLLVWQGSVAKANFNRFLIHQCRTEAAARKIFSDAGVPHYWDLATNFSEEI